ncbi:hypothetical protein FBULB1_11755 [Fusarium bulbicola]|nr:hypothetical protein FBULB1_11755 [Fusarium bulbicola]
MALLIDSITAASSVPIANRDERVALLPDINANIWPAQAPNQVLLDGADGSLRPLGLMLGDPYEITVKGTITYPNDWPESAKDNCVLRGVLKQNAKADIEVLRAVWKEEMLQSPAPRQEPMVIPFCCQPILSGPLSPAQFPKVPYGLRGDVEWSVETEKSNPAKKLPVTVTTRLEIYVLPGAAPGGPTEAIDPSAVKVNLQGKWPINLLRAFVPGPKDYENVSSEVQSNFYEWWAGHAVSRIQAQGATYDAVEGRSGHGLGSTGGSIDFNGWYDDMAKQFKSSVNSFDITALLEASFVLLPQELQSPIWVCLTPVGTIADKVNFSMIPHGWTMDKSPEVQGGVVTPFFRNTKSTFVQGGVNKILVTSWLESQTQKEGPNAICVVQAAFLAKGPKEEHYKADTADIQRTSFLRRHFQDWSALETKNNCFYTSDAFKPVPPVGGLENSLYRKVGLSNLRGVNEPYVWTYAGNKPSPIPIPDPVLNTITTLLSKSDKRNLATSADRARLINGGSLRPARIFPLLTGSLTYIANDGDFRLVVGRDISVATYLVPLASYGVTSGANAKIKISTLSSFSDAIDMLAVSLSGFESSLDQVVLPNDPMHTYGNYMIRTSRCLLLVRNNLLLDLTIPGVDIYDKKTEDALVDIASKLDAYFSKSSVGMSQLRKAAFQIGDRPEQVKSQQAFDVTLTDVDYLTNDMGIYIAAGTSSVQQPIICTSVGAIAADASIRQSSRKLSFFAVLKDNTNLSLHVSLSISAAHQDTFFTSTKTITIIVNQAGD